MKMQIKLVIASALLLSSSLALAGGYVDGNGVTYKMTKNAHGVVLKSKNTTLYLGNACDADSNKYGKGSWGWANGGVSVKLKKKTIGFPRQDSPFADNRCAL
ncbi:MAG: hypothetical protein PHE17_07000 [Thiothrix sp.]|uniref:hypothetical protein n=1 Tax=Thiothrix sp. TaxID=1032 RepID=UPI00260D462D|nr:hypothetical protein [Thiothrix sp.]MDD5392750.1 hypothetical protein [Thiothrix sp.]